MVSVDALQSSVNDFAKENGYGVVRHNGSGSQLWKTRYVFQCDRYGEPRTPRGAGLRQRRSRKCGCMWKVIAEALEQNDYLWTLRAFADPQHSQHNHDRTLSLSAHPVHRRLTDSVKATIEATSRRVGIRARDVRGIVQEKHLGAHFTRRDIYNARALLRREKLGGLSPTAALIKLFDERGIPHIVKWSASDPGRLVGLVWTFPYCLRMWKRFPEIMSFDNTYNTNRFKLPLFQLADCFPLDLPNEGLKVPGYTTKALVVVMNCGKTNQHGRMEYGSALRHRDPRSCLVGALAFWFFWRWQVERTEKFPVFQRSEDWYDTKVLRRSAKEPQAKLSSQTAWEWTPRFY
ncbi:hypothetical protein HIM_10579 [Hirsutella minnesotensis 3608]|uniref:Ndc10 domain-containing protein n=1 Tax=Hirsutella minnesotensis 3608 TaxID=1043627 RepID=A0A0F7ZRQ6_9HYPO|nr:hypothetical protein HIM_10579 [Hirsutella minnesotensis 3608]